MFSLVFDVTTLMLVGIAAAAAVSLWRRPHPSTWVFPVSVGCLALLAWGSWQDGNLAFLVVVVGVMLLLGVLWVGTYRGFRWARIGARWFYGALFLCAGLFFTIQPLRNGEGAFVEWLAERSGHSASVLPFLAGAVVLCGTALLVVVFRSPRRASQLKQAAMTLFGMGAILVLLRLAAGYDTLGGFPSEAWLDGVVGYVTPILCVVYLFART